MWRDEFGGNLETVIANRTEPLILVNSPVSRWDIVRRWTPKYLQRHLPKLLEVSLSKRKQNLYGTDERDIKLSPKQFFKRLKALGEGETPQDRKYPYYSLNLEDLVKYEPESVLRHDMLRTPVHQAAIGGGGHPLSTGRTAAQLTLWIGATNVSAVAHYDDVPNSYVQIQGSKRFLLIHPQYAPSMYLHAAATKSHRHSQIIDTSAEDILSKFPKFGKVKFLEAIVHPGDVLFMPAFWIHEVLALSTSVSVSIWSEVQPFSENYEKISLVFSKKFLFLCQEYLFREGQTEEEHRLSYLKLHQYFLIRYLQQYFAGNSTAASKFLHDDILVPKFYTPKMKHKWCSQGAEEAQVACPSPLEDHIFPPILMSAIDLEVDDNVRLLSHGYFRGAVDVFASSVEYLAHQALTFKGVPTHEDQSSYFVCWFLRDCVLPHI